MATYIPFQHLLIYIRDIWERIIQHNSPLNGKSAILIIITCYKWVFITWIKKLSCHENVLLVFLHTFVKISCERIANLLLHTCVNLHMCNIAHVCKTCACEHSIRKLWMLVRCLQKVLPLTATTEQSKWKLSTLHNYFTHSVCGQRSYKESSQFRKESKRSIGKVWERTNHLTAIVGLS